MAEAKSIAHHVALEFVESSLFGTTSEVEARFADHSSIRFDGAEAANGALKFKVGGKRSAASAAARFARSVRDVLLNDSGFLKFVFTDGSDWFMHTSKAVVNQTNKLAQQVEEELVRTLLVPGTTDTVRLDFKDGSALAFAVREGEVLTLKAEGSTKASWLVSLVTGLRIYDDGSTLELLDGSMIRLPVGPSSLRTE